MPYENQATEFTYFRIFTNLKMIPSNYNKHVESSVELPFNLNASPLYIDADVEFGPYTYDSVETVYISTTDDFVDFKMKLAFLIRYSAWQPDAYEPGPFRELLWPGNFIRPSKAKALLHDFAICDEKARALRDVCFYRTYCTLRKYTARLARLEKSENFVCLAETFTQCGHTPASDVIEYPFLNMPLNDDTPCFDAADI